MRKLVLVSLYIFCFCPLFVFAQKTRGLLQQEFIIKNFIDPQFKQSGPLKIASNQTMDSLFTAITASWKKAAPDTLKKYPMDVSLEDFKHVDAYCYFWTCASIAQQLNIPRKIQQHLVKAYMLPAMFEDLKTLKAKPTLTSVKLIHTGTLDNTLALGSDDRMDKETVLSCYELYTAFDETFRSLMKADTAVGRYAQMQLNEMEHFKYDLNARSAYYNGNTDKAYQYVLTGLSNDSYPKSRLNSISKKLIASFKKNHDPEKSYTLLNTIFFNTTADNLNRDTLSNWYLSVDSLKGKQMYSSVLSKLSKSSFRKTGQVIRLPNSWNFTSKAISPERLKKVKYFFVDVWYTSCGPCILEIPDNNAIYEKLKNREDVLFVGINTDYKNGKYSKDYVIARSKELKVNFPVIYDTDNLKLNDQLAVNAYPQKFIISSKGEILAKTDQSSIERKSFDLFISELK